MFSSNDIDITFDAAAVENLRDISFSENGEQIDTTVIGDVYKLWEEGTVDLEATLEVLGQSSLARGAVGDLVFTFPDGSSPITLADAKIFTREVKGSLDSEFTTSLTFKKARV